MRSTWHVFLDFTLMPSSAGAQNLPPFSWLEPRHRQGVICLSFTQTGGQAAARCRMSSSCSPEHPHLTLASQLLGQNARHKAELLSYREAAAAW